MRWLLFALLMLNVFAYYWLVARPQVPALDTPRAQNESVPRIELAGAMSAANKLPDAPLLEPGADASNGLCWYIGLYSDFTASDNYDPAQAGRTLAYVLERMRAIALDAQPVQIDVAGPTEHWVEVAASDLSAEQLLKQLLADGYDVYLVSEPARGGRVVAGPFDSRAEAEREVDILQAAGWQARREQRVPRQRQHWLRLPHGYENDPVPASWWAATVAEWPGLVKRRYYCAGIAQSGQLE